MITHIALLVMLAVFSGLSMNLIVQLGLGLKEVVFDKNFKNTQTPAGKWAALGIIFITILVLWLIVLFVRSILPMGMLEYLLVFPAGFLVFSGLEYLAQRCTFITIRGQGIFSVLGSSHTVGSLCAAAVFIMLNIAGNLIEAAVLSFGFTLGTALALSIVTEIRRRSTMEAVPRFLQDGPLVLITMGLLSLIFSSAALMFFQTLGEY